jgi:hypothetical protein
VTEWWRQYYNKRTIGNVELLLKNCGVTNSTLHDRWLERAALYRLAFASLKLDIQEPISSTICNICPEVIISRTAYGMKKSRPISAKWAFWFGYSLRQEQTLTSDFLSRLISVLLGRSVSKEEVRTVLSRLRKEAIEHATEASSILFRNNLYPDMSDTEYEADLRTHVDNAFSKNSQLGWFIVNGKIQEEHLKMIVKIRRAILLRMGILGHLMGKEPFVRIDKQSKIIHGVPIPITGGFVFNSSVPKGKIHLEKENEIPFPEPFLQQTTKPIGRSSVNIEKNDKGLTTLSLKFPMEAITGGEPCASVLYAVPIWWPYWLRYMPIPLDISKKQVTEVSYIQKMT